MAEQSDVLVSSTSHEFIVPKLVYGGFLGFIDDSDDATKCEAPIIPEPAADAVNLVKNETEGESSGASQDACGKRNMQLASLNKDTHDRIEAEVLQNPACNLVPILKDYEKCLAQIGITKEQSSKPMSASDKVVEAGAEYSKRCRVFLKGDELVSSVGNGTLYLKITQESGKTELLVRPVADLDNSGPDDYDGLLEKRCFCGKM